MLQPGKHALPLMAPKPPPKRIGYYTDASNRGYLAPEVQLRELKARLASGQPLEAAAALMPVYVGGPVEKAHRLGPHAPAGAWLTAARAAEAAAKAAAAKEGGQAQ
jgi:hypothetical protein